MCRHPAARLLQSSYFIKKLLLTEWVSCLEITRLEFGRWIAPKDPSCIVVEILCVVIVRVQ